VAVSTLHAGRLAAGMVSLGGMVKQEAWKETGAWRREMGAPGRDGQRGACRWGGVRQAVTMQ